MSDPAEMFKKLAQGRRLKEEPQPESKTPAQTETKVEESDQENSPEVTEQPSEEARRKADLEEIAVEPTKKRGRPATGKRSDPDWIGRTYYIRKETDFDIEYELVKLKRAGVNLDKSELVDFLLGAWVKWRKGENMDSQIAEISPRQKDELP